MSQASDFTDRVPDLVDGRSFHSLAPDEAADLLGDLWQAGEAGVEALVDALDAQEGSGDWKARFLLHALANQAGDAVAVGADQRAALTRQLTAMALEDHRPPGVRTFLLHRLQWLAGDDEAPALAPLVADPAPDVRDAAAAVLTAVGEAAIEPLRGQLEGAGPASRLAIEHALLQID